MRVIAKKTLRQFWLRYPDAEQKLKAWYAEAEKANWVSPNYVKEAYPNARLIPDNRIIFNIKGNHYRLVVKVNYKYGMVWIRFVRTHEEYDETDPTKI